MKLIIKWGGVLELRKCSVCLEDKPLIPLKFVNKKWTYVDETGRRWHHKKCSTCYAIYRRETDLRALNGRTGKFTWMNK